MLNDLIRASPKQHLLWTFLGPQGSVNIKKFEVLNCPPNFTDLSPMYWTNNQLPTSWSQTPQPTFSDESNLCFFGSKKGDQHNIS